MANSISFMDVMCNNTFAVALKQVNAFWSYGLIAVSLNSFCLTCADLFAVSKEFCICCSKSNNVVLCIR